MNKLLGSPLKTIKTTSMEILVVSTSSIIISHSHRFPPKHEKGRKKICGKNYSIVLKLKISLSKSMLTELSRDKNYRNWYTFFFRLDSMLMKICTKRF